MVTWLLHRAASRWPADIRDELLKEWTAEIRTIERDPTLSAFRRNRLRLGFSISLALSRPGGEPAFGWKRVAVVLSAWMLMLVVIQQGWQRVVGFSGDNLPLHLGSRLAQGAVALLPVLLAVAAGWWLGRRSPAGRARALPLGLYLIAAVAVWVGLGFISDRLLRGSGVAFGLPLMGYQYGSQPYGMVTSWVVWLIAFALLASAITRVRARWRPVAAAGVSVLVTWLAVTAATFVQFDSFSAPRRDMWMWFGQWLVPPHPDADPGLGGFQFARDAYVLVSSYPHVLLAVAAFGLAFLVANGLGIESSRSRV